MRALTIILQYCTRMKETIESAIHFYQRFIDLASLSHPALSVQVKKHIKTLK